MLTNCSNCSDLCTIDLPYADPGTIDLPYADFPHIANSNTPRGPSWYFIDADKLHKLHRPVYDRFPLCGSLYDRFPLCGFWGAKSETAKGVHNDQMLTNCSNCTDLCTIDLPYADPCTIDFPYADFPHIISKLPNPEHALPGDYRCWQIAQICVR